MSATLPTILGVFPSLKARWLMAILQRRPLEYRVKRQAGSHRVLESPNGYPELRFSFHDRVTIPPGAVRKILTRDVGLNDDEALALIWKVREMTEVSIRYHQEPQGWWAESEEIPGWTGVGASLEEVREQAISAARLYAGEGAILREIGLPTNGDIGETASP